MKLCLNQVY